ncbi:hypothetical protein IE81DRAFT_349908 [Ceraceosorus guamensis]|uniref:Uncharacterized protein n=1 Tax=Ceraceosorus guamensis TaxID=1522189 RepID=A0A316VQ23_9BASI|nr:hypothetical protein IE81DRAFT_349908 [Ceraceosorus guamensis]PWN39749.1 hypothetical protein IE81DRAFT_349908 [Ceraceosorus guamensis]
MSDQSALSSAAGVAAGHAKLAQGAASEAIGNATGSEAWQQSGADTKAAATQEIKQAAQSGPDAKAQGGVTGTAAELADKACPQTGDGVGSK